MVIDLPKLKLATYITVTAKKNTKVGNSDINHETLTRWAPLPLINSLKTPVSGLANWIKLVTGVIKTPTNWSDGPLGYNW